ncbi:AAA family ATPase [Sphingomonas sp. PAMC 26605]|uniref:AAA family ATPase n=1 Tax=Sphingomonas sp. PAMC 26605 TaxID=1112214 RepID=UPI00026CB9B2|nr:AAA family ATPase [Sphingomonas sp. PAMC 26605]
MTPRPQLWVFAGPNGAGKSTLADRFVRGRIPIVNPDNIARELPRTADGGLAELAAGKLALKERDARLRARETFAFETTLSGGTELKAMRDATAAGYKVNLVYVGVSDPAISMARVSERVRRGGHDVDDRAVARRYAASLRQLPEAMALADRTFVFDNGGRRHRLLLVRDDERVRLASALPQWARSAIPSELRRDPLEAERADRQMAMIEKVASRTLAGLPDARKRVVDEGSATLQERLDQGKPINPTSPSDRNPTAPSRAPFKPKKDRKR